MREIKLNSPPCMDHWMLSLAIPNLKCGIWLLGIPMFFADGLVDGSRSANAVRRLVKAVGSSLRSSISRSVGPIGAVRLTIGSGVGVIWLIVKLVEPVRSVRTAISRSVRAVRLTIGLVAGSSITVVGSAVGRSVEVVRSTIRLVEPVRLDVGAIQSAVDRSVRAVGLTIGSIGAIGSV